MELIDIEEIETIHEDYSLNINSLIENFKKNPTEYMIFKDIAENKEQTILIMDKKCNTVLDMRLSENCISIAEEKSGMEYILESEEGNSVKERENCKIQEFTVIEELGEETEIYLNLATLTSNEGKKETVCLSGEFMGIEAESEEMISLRFDIEELDDDEIEEIDENDEGEYENDEIEDIDENDEEYGHNEDENYESNEYYEDDENYENYSIIEDGDSRKKMYLNFYNASAKCCNNELSDEEYEDIKEKIYVLYKRIAEDLDTRIVEIVRLKNSISDMLKIYSKTNSRKECGTDREIGD